jgi:hypothetical protein
MQPDEKSEEISNNIKSIVEHVNEVEYTNLSTFPEKECNASKDRDAPQKLQMEMPLKIEMIIDIIDMLAFEPIIYQVPTPSVN